MEEQQDLVTVTLPDGKRVHDVPRGEEGKVYEHWESIAPKAIVDKAQADTQTGIYHETMRSIYGLLDGIANYAPMQSLSNVMEAAVPGSLELSMDMQSAMIPVFKLLPSYRAEDPVEYFTGKTKEERASMGYEERRDALVQGRKDKTQEWMEEVSGTQIDPNEFETTRLIGMFADPTTLIPASAVTKVGSFLRGGAIGATDLALYEEAHEGGATASGAALGFVAGGTLSAGMKAFGNRMTRKAEERATREAQQAATKVVDSVFASMQASDRTPTAAFREALKELGLKKAEFNKIIQDAGGGIPEVDSAKKWIDSYGDYSIKMENEASEKVRKQFGWIKNPKAKESAIRFMEYFDRGLEPISSGIKKRSERMWGLLRRYEAGSIMRQHKMLEAIHPIAKDFHNLSKAKPDVYQELKMLAYNMTKKGNATRFNQIIKENGLEADWKKAVDMFKKNADEYGKVDPQFKAVQHYFPRRVKDYKGLQASWMAKLDKETQDWLTKKLNALKTDKARADTLTAFMSGRLVRKGNKLVTAPGSANKRTVAKVDEELEQFYYEPHDALMFWARDAAEGMEKKLLFQRIGKDAEKVLKENNGDVSSALEQFLQKEHGMDLKDAQEVAHLMDVRLNGIHNASPGAIRFMKNSTYGMLLANPISAITQFGDLAFIAYKTGFKNTVTAILKDTADGMQTKLDPTDLGIMQSLTAEFVDKPTSGKFVSKLMEYGQFTRTDAFTKRVALRAFANKQAKALKTQKGAQAFRKKYGVMFEDSKEIDDVMNKIRKGDYEDMDVRSVLLSELADIQPVFASELPAAYWKHPMARLFYTLRSFTLKHIDLMRNEYRAGMKEGDWKKAASNLGKLVALFTAANFSTDLIKQAILVKGGEGVNAAMGNRVEGRDIMSADNLGDLAVRNLLKNTALFTKYDLDNVLEKSNPVSSTMAIAAPPADAFDPVVTAVRDVLLFGKEPTEGRKFTDKIPLFGKVYENWFGDIFDLVGGVGDKKGPGIQYDERRRILRERREKKAERRERVQNPSIYPWMN